MRVKIHILLLVLCCLWGSFCVLASDAEVEIEAVQIAFMPDIHFHDVYGNFADGSFKGILNSVSGKRATIRTLQAEVTSTRLFNENYFALLAALDDVVTRGIKLVALPGDFSDDGQPVHMRGLKSILDHYRHEYGLRFFATPGNHDPVKPFDSPGGEPDFLGENGQKQRIYSKGANECQDYQEDWATADNGGPLKTICTEDIRHLGYKNIMAIMAEFGFYPQADDLYWETPYANYTQQQYHFLQAAEQAGFDKRQYQICHQGTGGAYIQGHYSACVQVADASYLVEPVPGVWLLAIDANVYIPELRGDTRRFSGSGNAGYNKLLSHKTQVLDWIRSVVARADASGKQLIAFSHFPMTEFYDGQSARIAELFGDNSFQLARRPSDKVSAVLADTGLQVHVGGHMHLNDTGVVRTAKGNTLFNIQAPSLGAYVPAYKVLTLHGKDKIEVQTIVLNQIPRFSELFEHYRQEHQAYTRDGVDPPWDPAVLSANSYREFTDWHIRELTRLRFLPREWPEDLKNMLFNMNGLELLALLQLPRKDILQAGFEQSDSWRAALESIEETLLKAGMQPTAFIRWNGFELAQDFYRLRNAGSLALDDIGVERIKQYQWMCRYVSRTGWSENISPVKKRLIQLLAILDGLQQGEPDDHFLLDLNKGAIQRLPR